MYLGQSLVAGFQSKPKEAKEFLEAGLKELPTSPRLLQSLFDMQLQQNDAKSARVTLQKLGSSRYPPELKEFREAQLLALEGNYLEASRRLEKLRPQLANVRNLVQARNYLQDADLLLMECYGSLGLHDLSLTTARRLATESRNSFESQVGIAASLLSLGKNDDAQIQYEKLLAIATDPNAADPKVKAFIPQITAALVQLQIAEQLKLPADAHDWSRVEGFISNARKQGYLNEPAPTLMQVQVLVRKGDMARARDLLDQLIQAFPDNIAVFSVRVDLALQEGNAEEALQLIESASPKLRSEVRLTLKRIDALLAKGGKKEDIVKSLQGVYADVQQLSPSDRAKVYTNLGAAYARLGERDKGLTIWNEAGQLEPHDAKTRWLIFDAVRETDDLAAMKDLTQWFQTEFGRDSSQAQLCEAAELTATVREEQRSKSSAQQDQFVLSDANKEDLLRARNLLRAVESVRPEWYERPRILAEIDVLEGKLDDAVGDLQQALQLGPANSFLVNQLVRLLFITHRNAEAKDVLENYGALVGGSLGSLKVQSDVQVGDKKQALVEFEKIMPPDSKNAGDHLYHAKLLAVNGRLDEAEAEFRRSTQLGPDDPDNWLGLVNFLVLNGRSLEARTEIQHAQIALPEEKRNIALAQGYQAIGDQSLADEYYQAAMDAAPNNARIRQMAAGYFILTKRYELAKPLVAELLKLKPTSGQDRDLQAWARRASAQMLSADGSYESFQQALKFLEPAPGEKSAPSDLVVRISLLASRPEASAARRRSQRCRNSNKTAP